MLAANRIGGQLALGLESLGLMTAFGLVVLLAGRSETVCGLRGDGRDERFTMIDLRATAMAGQVMILTVIIAWLVEVAQGRSGSPYYWLASIGGVSYLVAVVVAPAGLRPRPGTACAAGSLGAQRACARLPPAPVGWVRG